MKVKYFVFIYLKDKCDYSCLTCDKEKTTQCLSCPENSFRELNDSLCDCKDNFFDNKE